MFYIYLHETYKKKKKGQPGVEKYITKVEGEMMICLDMCLESNNTIKTTI